MFISSLSVLRFFLAIVYDRNYDSIDLYFISWSLIRNIFFFFEGILDILDKIEFHFY